MTERAVVRGLATIAVLSFLLSVVGHLLPPSIYAPANLLFDYEFGVIRRGLVGTLLAPYFGEVATLAEFHAVSIAVTLSGAVAVAAIAFARLWDGLAPRLLAIILLNSFAFRSVVGATGFLDGVLLVLVAVGMLMPVRGVGAVALRTLCCLIGVAVHENMLPYFAVLLGLDLWLGSDRSLRALAAAAVPGLAGAALAAALFIATAANLPDPETFGAYLNSRHNIAQDFGALPTIAHGLGEQAEILAERRAAGHSYWYWLAFDGGPLWLMTLWLIWLNLKVLPRNEPVLTRLLLVGAVLAPLSLNLVAYDVVRFGSISVLVGFFALGLVQHRSPGARARLSALVDWRMFALVLILNLHLTTLQINNFEGHIDDLPWSLLHHSWWAF